MTALCVRLEHRFGDARRQHGSSLETKWVRMIYVFCLDSGFVMPTGVAVRSLDRFLTRSDRIVLLHLGLSPREMRDLGACVINAEVEFHECSGRLRPSWIPPSHVSEAAFLRYLAPEILDTDERCVYLDGDVIVRRSPQILHDTDLEGNTLAAVRSRVAPFAASPGGIVAWFEEGIPSTAPYFNSGMLVIDLDRWRSRKITDKLTSYLDRHVNKAYLADQEALNSAVVGDWMAVGREWNYITHVTESFLQQPELEPKDPGVVHFAGRHKPWVHGRFPLFAEEWYGIAQTTPWADFKTTPPTPKRGLKHAGRRVAGRALRRLKSLAAEPNK